MTDLVLLHVSDWNLQDRWYEVPRSSLRELRERVRTGDVRNAWDWLLEESGARRCDESADHTLDELFFDYTNPVESVDEWEDEDLEA